MKCKTARRILRKKAWAIASDDADIIPMSNGTRRFIGRCTSVLRVCKKRNLTGLNDVKPNLKVTERVYYNESLR